MATNKLGLIISNEYHTDITSKSFWISTIVVPVLYILFCIVLGAMLEDSDTLKSITNPVGTEQDDLSGWQILAMLSGMFLTLFLMIYGSQIYSKVRKEKVNRIIEVLATSVDGKTMMLAKIISVFLIGITQLAIWVVFLIAGFGIFLVMASPALPMDIFANPHLYLALLWTLLFFIGGYLFYGSIYAACGAMTDKDNENQGYMTLITFVLLFAFYIEQYAVDNQDALLTQICNFIPFTAPALGPVNAIAGDSPIWLVVLQLVVLYVFALFSIALSGKIYTSSLLLKGRKFSPKDILVFLKSK